MMSSTHSHDLCSRREGDIILHQQRYCLCAGFSTLSALVTSLIRIVNLFLAIFVATTEEFLAVQIFTSALAIYQVTCLMIHMKREERVNPNTSLYEFTKSQHETIKMVLAVIVGLIMAVCLPYLTFFTDEIQWRHAGGGVLLFVFPASFDYRIRRSILYLLLGIRPENKNETGDTDIDNGFILLWMGKYFQMPVELGPVLAYALAEQHDEIVLISTLVMTMGLILVGVVARTRPGNCWISRDGKVHIPVNASKAELSYAGYLASYYDACDDERVVYVASGDVAKDIPRLLEWIAESDLPEAGRWGQVLGSGNAETGTELCVEQCFGKSILYRHDDVVVGSTTTYIHLGQKVFEIQGGGYMKETSSKLELLDGATSVSGSWEIM